MGFMIAVPAAAGGGVDRHPTVLLGRFHVAVAEEHVGAAVVAFARPEPVIRAYRIEAVGG